ncbi:MAG: hypothetical protein C4294_02155 [Nitrospiraceae bacterium]
MLNCFDHEWCQALSILFRGDLCATLTDRPGRLIDRGTYLYTAGDRGQSVYVVRRGLIKVSLLSAPACVQARGDFRRALLLHGVSE